MCPRELIMVDEEDLVPPSAASLCPAKNFGLNSIDISDGTRNNDPVEDVSELADVTRIDISGAEINRLSDMHHRFSQSNVDHHCEGINLPISNQEDDMGNEVHMQEEMIYGKNQVTPQMEQMMAPSDADVCIPTSGYEPAPLKFSDYGFALGREFPNINALKNALSDMAVETGREYEHVRTSPSKLIRKCSSEGCNWHIRARRMLRHSPTFKVVKYQEVHTCVVRTNGGDKDHSQATVRWILSKVQSNVEKDPNMEPSKIVKEMKDRYGILISYNKAVKAKTQALNLMRNQRKDSYASPHPDICGALIKDLEHGGTICRLGLSSDGSSFQHLFWAFPACIDALRNHLRPVVQVGKEQTQIGVLMYARGIDGDGFSGRTIEVGFALCVTGDERAWEAFLGWLKEFVLPPTFAIVTYFQETALTRAIENVLPHLHHFFYLWSFMSVFSEKFEDPNLYDLCRKACETFSAEKCEAALQEIKSKNKEAYEWLESVGSKSHWATAFSPNKHVGGAWGLYFYPFDKTSIVDIVESSRDMLDDQFSRNRMKGAELITTTGLTPAVMRDIGVTQMKLPEYKVESINEDKCQVTYNGIINETLVVDLEERSCTCGRFQATEYPCWHAFWTITHLELDVKDYVTHPWYTLDTYRATYAGSLPPPICVDISKWSVLPPRRRRVGRPRKL